MKLLYVVGLTILVLLLSAQTQIPSTSWVQTNFANVPSGVIVLISSGACPSGFTEVTALNGKMLRGTLAANGDVGGTGGNATITPTGTNSTVSFTPAGTNGTVSFTPVGTNAAISAGTPAGTISALTTGADSSTTGGVAKAIAQTPTFTGSALGTHNHTFTGTSGTVPAETFTGSSGTVPAETFTGNAIDPSPSYVKVIFCSKT